LEQAISIELMSEQNLPEVYKIEQKSFKHPWCYQSFLAELELSHMSCYLVIRLGKEVAGYIGAWIMSEEVHITTLAVDEPYRRNGIAKYLVAELIKRVKPLGASYITLEVRPSNQAARRFYESLGFKIMGRRRYYYPDEDALIMILGKLPDPEKLVDPQLVERAKQNREHSFKEIMNRAMRESTKNEDKMNDS